MTKKTSVYIIVNLTIAFILMLGIVLILIPGVFITSTRIAPGLFGNTLIKVDSAAMLPDFDRGEIVVIKNSEPAEIGSGDKIAYYTFDGQGNLTDVVFRVVAAYYENDFGERFFEVKGISGSSTEEKLVHQSAIIGKFNEDAVFLKGLFTFAASGTGVIVLVVTPAILSVGVQFVFYIIHFRKESATEKKSQ